MNTGRTLVAAVTTGLITGLADVVSVALLTPDGRDLLYLSPSVFVVVPALCVAVCSSMWLATAPRRLRRYRALAIASAGPGIFLIARAGPFIKHELRLPVSQAVILTGVLAAATVAFVSRARVSRADRALRYGAVIVGAVLIGAGIVQHLALQPKNPAPNRKFRNVVLIFLDTVRYDDAHTMNSLRTLAADAVVFENAWAPSPWTVPSHVAVFAAQDPWRLPFDPRTLSLQYSSLTMAEDLAARGYTTAAVFANPILAPSAGFNRGFQQFHHAPSAPACRSVFAYVLMKASAAAGLQPRACGRMKASEVANRAAEFIHTAKRPYFIALNFIDAHHPYDVDPGCAAADLRPVTSEEWNEVLLNTALKRGDLSSAVLARIRNQYRATIACMDRSLTALLAETARQGMDDTIVAVVSDHGEHFGEHRRFGHGNSAYAQLLHVPLMIQAPGLPPGRIDAPVSIGDLGLTLLRLAEPGRRMPKDLLIGPRRLVAASYSCADLGSSCGPGGFAAVGRRFHLIRFEDGREEIYDYRADPDETSPLRSVDDPAVAPIRAMLLSNMRSTANKATGFGGLGYLQ